MSSRFASRPQSCRTYCSSKSLETPPFSPAKFRISHTYELAPLLHQNSANNSFVSHTYRHPSRNSFRLHTYEKTGGGGCPRRLRLSPALFSLFAHSLHSCGNKSCSCHSYENDLGYTPAAQKNQGPLFTRPQPCERTNIPRSETSLRACPSFEGSRNMGHGSRDTKPYISPFRHFVTSFFRPKKPYPQPYHHMAQRTGTVVLSRVYTRSSQGLGRLNSCNPLRQNF